VDCPFLLDGTLFGPVDDDQMTKALLDRERILGSYPEDSIEFVKHGICIGECRLRIFIATQAI
jgi:hypothetical protein